MEGHTRQTPGRPPLTVHRASSRGSQAGRTHGSSWDKEVGLGGWRPGQHASPEKSWGGENVRAQEWALETAGGSPPPSTPSCPLSSRTVISRCVHAHTQTHTHTPPRPQGKDQPQAADRRLPGPGVADVHTILMGKKRLTMNRLPGPVPRGEHHSESSISLKISSDKASK